MRKRENVTVGQSTKNTFVVPASNALPRTFVLFDLSPQGYALNFTDAMDGRVSLGDQVVALPALRQAGKAQKKGDLWHLMLTDRARGKVVIGDVTVLFQFVAPPPIQPRPQLPPSVRSSLMQNLDWMLVAVVGASFLLHFGFVVYLRNVDWPRVRDPEVIDVEIGKIYPVKQQEPPKPADVPKAPEKPAEKKVADKGEGKKAKSDPGPKKPVHVATDEEKAAAAAAAKEAAERKEADRVAALNAAIAKKGVLAQLTSKGRGGVVSDTLKHGRPSDDADKTLKSIGGVEGASGDGRPGLHQSGGTGDGTHHGTGGTISLNGTSAVGTGEKAGGTAVIVKGHTEIGKAKVDGDLSSDLIAGVVRRNLGSMTACYESALKRSGSLSGKVTVEFTVSAVGKVTEVDFKDDTLGSDDVTSCMKVKIKGWVFPASKGESNISHPFVFTKAN